jgi:L-ascorbate metabolism protein UlaG (beta-lactamase superfamily)
MAARCPGNEGTSMVFRIVGLLALLLGGFGICTAESLTTVTYIANEGFLIEIGTKKVLIDALFDDRRISYCQVPDEATLLRMRDGGAPFDDIDLILLTHNHRDHFSAEIVLSTLEKNPATRLIGPLQATRSLVADPSIDDQVVERILGVDLEPFESLVQEVEGVRITAIRLPHSRYEVVDAESGETTDRHRNVFNLAFLIEVGKTRLLHVGDAVLDQSRKYFEEGLYPEGAVDLAFLEYFDSSPSTQEILERWIKPKRIVFMHLPAEEEKIEELSRMLSPDFPNSMVFKVPLQSMSFEASE